jgi:hypothetical protein
MSNKKCLITTGKDAQIIVRGHQFSARSWYQVQIDMNNDKREGYRKHCMQHLGLDQQSYEAVIAMQEEKAKAKAKAEEESKATAADEKEEVQAEATVESVSECDKIVKLNPFEEKQRERDRIKRERAEKRKKFREEVILPFEYVYANRRFVSVIPPRAKYYKWNNIDQPEEFFDYCYQIVFGQDDWSSYSKYTYGLVGTVVLTLPDRFHHIVRSSQCYRIYGMHGLCPSAERYRVTNNCFVRLPPTNVEELYYHRHSEKCHDFDSIKCSVSPANFNPRSYDKRPRNFADHKWKYANCVDDDFFKRVLAFESVFKMRKRHDLFQTHSLSSRNEKIGHIHTDNFVYVEPLARNVYGTNSKDWEHGIPYKKWDGMLFSNKYGHRLGS